MDLRKNEQKKFLERLMSIIKRNFQNKKSRVIESLIKHIERKEPDNEGSSEKTSNRLSTNDYTGVRDSLGTSGFYNLSHIYKANGPEVDCDINSFMDISNIDNQVNGPDEPTFAKKFNHPVSEVNTSCYITFDAQIDKKYKARVENLGQSMIGFDNSMLDQTAPLDPSGMNMFTQDNSVIAILEYDEEQNSIDSMQIQDDDSNQSKDDQFKSMIGGFNVSDLDKRNTMDFTTMHGNQFILDPQHSNPSATQNISMKNKKKHNIRKSECFQKNFHFESGDNSVANFGTPKNNRVGQKHFNLAEECEDNIKNMRPKFDGLYQEDTKKRPRKRVTQPLFRSVLELDTGNKSYDSPPKSSKNIKFRNSIRNILNDGNKEFSIQFFENNNKTKYRKFFTDTENIFKKLKTKTIAIPFEKIFESDFRIKKLVNLIETIRLYKRKSIFDCVYSYSFKRAKNIIHLRRFYQKTKLIHIRKTLSILKVFFICTKTVRDKFELLDNIIQRANRGNFIEFFASLQKAKTNNDKQDFKGGVQNNDKDRRKKTYNVFSQEVSDDSKNNSQKRECSPQQKTKEDFINNQANFNTFFNQDNNSLQPNSNLISSFQKENSNQNSQKYNKNIFKNQEIFMKQNSSFKKEDENKSSEKESVLMEDSSERGDHILRSLSWMKGRNVSSNSRSHTSAMSDQASFSKSRRSSREMSQSSLADKSEIRSINNRYSDYNEDDYGDDYEAENLITFKGQKSNKDPKTITNIFHNLKISEQRNKSSEEKHQSGWSGSDKQDIIDEPSRIIMNPEETHQKNEDFSSKFNSLNRFWKNPIIKKTKPKIKKITSCSPEIFLNKTKKKKLTKKIEIEIPGESNYQTKTNENLTENKIKSFKSICPKNKQNQSSYQSTSIKASDSLLFRSKRRQKASKSGSRVKDYLNVFEQSNREIKSKQSLKINVIPSTSLDQSNKSNSKVKNYCSIFEESNREIRNKQSLNQSNNPKYALGFRQNNAKPDLTYNNLRIIRNKRKNTMKKQLNHNQLQAIGSNSPVGSFNPHEANTFINNLNICSMNNISNAKNNKDNSLDKTSSAPFKGFESLQVKSSVKRNNLNQSQNSRQPGPNKPMPANNHFSNNSRMTSKSFEENNKFRSNMRHAVLALINFINKAEEAKIELRPNQHSMFLQKFLSVIELFESFLATLEKFDSNSFEISKIKDVLFKISNPLKQVFNPNNSIEYNQNKLKLVKLTMLLKVLHFLLKILDKETLIGNSVYLSESVVNFQQHTTQESRSTTRTLNSPILTNSLFSLAQSRSAKLQLGYASKQYTSKPGVSNVFRKHLSGRQTGIDKRDYCSLAVKTRPKKTNRLGRRLLTKSVRTQEINYSLTNFCALLNIKLKFKFKKINIEVFNLLKNHSKTNNRSNSKIFKQDNKKSGLLLARKKKKDSNLHLINQKLQKFVFRLFFKNTRFKIKSSLQLLRIHMRNQLKQSKPKALKPKKHINPRNFGSKNMIRNNDTSFYKNNSMVNDLSMTDKMNKFHNMNPKMHSTMQFSKTSQSQRIVPPQKSKSPDHFFMNLTKEYERKVVDTLNYNHPSQSNLNYFSRNHF